MPATNMAPVSLSSSLFSVTMYNLGPSPRLLTMSFHIMLLHTRSCSQQAITQLLCLESQARFLPLMLSESVTGNTLAIRKSLAVELVHHSPLALFTPRCIYILRSLTRGILFKAST